MYKYMYMYMYISYIVVMSSCHNKDSLRLYTCACTRSVVTSVGHI